MCGDEVRKERDWARRGGTAGASGCGMYDVEGVAKMEKVFPVR